MASSLGTSPLFFGLYEEVMASQTTRKLAGKALTYDLAWCAKHLARGTPTWCVRTKEAGVVVAFVAEPIETFTQFNGLPVDEYTVHPMFMRDGEAHFGPECAWPREVKRA